MVLRSFLPMNLPRTMTQTILYMKVKVIWFLSLPGAQRWPKKRTMQPSQLFPDASQNQLYTRQKNHRGVVYNHCSPRPKAAPAVPASNTPILPLNGIYLNTKSKLLLIIVLWIHCTQKDKSFLIQATRHVRTEKKQKENTSKIPLTLHSLRIRAKQTFSPFLTPIQSAMPNQWTALSSQVTCYKTFFMLQLYSLENNTEFF